MPEPRLDNRWPSYRVTVPNREPRYFRTLNGAAREAGRWSEHYGNEPMPEYGYRDQVAVWRRAADGDAWNVLQPDTWIATLPTEQDAPYA